MRQHLQTACLSVIALLLAGYFLADKGFAHLGGGPVYAGEIFLALALMLFVLAPEFRSFAESRLVWVLLALDGWCLLQTVPYFEDYGVNTLRDAATYGYSLFALLVFALISGRDRVELVCRVYGRFVTWGVILMPVMIALSSLELGQEGEIPLVLIKPGDVSVHLAGALAFRLCGLHRSLRGSLSAEDGVGRLAVELLFWLGFVLSLIWSVSISRGGMLSLLAALAVLLAFGYVWRKALMLALAGGLLLAVMAVSSVTIQTGHREISVQQIFDNLTSILSGDDYGASGDLGNTMRWRLKWWGEIVDDVLEGDSFWTGRGFGINLASADRIQLEPDPALRNPHSSHMTFLARAGVPGLLLWLLLQGWLAADLWRRAWRLKQAGAQNWHRVNVWVLAYWLASLVNGSFDVYLEGPQGGIWFWAILGFALALSVVEKRLSLPGSPAVVRAG